MRFDIKEIWKLNEQASLLSLAIFLIGIWSLTLYVSQVLQKDMQLLLSNQQFSTVSVLAADINNELKDHLSALEKTATKITPAFLGNSATLQKFLEDNIVLVNMSTGGVYIARIDGTVIADVPVSTRL